MQQTNENPRIEKRGKTTLNYSVNGAQCSWRLRVGFWIHLNVFTHELKLVMFQGLLMWVIITMWMWKKNEAEFFSDQIAENEFKIGSRSTHEEVRKRNLYICSMENGSFATKEYVVTKRQMIFETFRYIICSGLSVHRSVIWRWLMGMSRRAERRASKRNVLDAICGKNGGNCSNVRSVLRQFWHFR